MKLQVAAFGIILLFALVGNCVAMPQQKKGAVERRPPYPGVPVPEVRCRLEPYEEAVTSIETRDKKVCNTVTEMRTEKYDCSRTEWSNNCASNKKLRVLGKGHVKSERAACQELVPQTCQKKVPRKEQKCHTKVVQVPVKGTRTRHRRVCDEPVRPSKKGGGY